MTLLKTIHVVCAYATGVGFLLRGILALQQSPLLGHRWVKTLPHIVDTALLGSAVAMLYAWSLNPLDAPWVSAKLLALLVYIAFGFAMLRFGSTPAKRWIGLVGGLFTYAYIIGVAHGKTPMPWLHLAGP